MPRTDVNGLSAEEARALWAQNTELWRLLTKHQWAGITPAKSYGACPECGGSKAPWSGHRPGCAIAAVLAEPPR